MPYDPHIAFNGEEDSMGIRSYTHGYDIYGAVDYNFALHYYGPREGSVVWFDQEDEWWKLDQAGVLRLRELLTSASGCHKKDVKRQFCLGKERTLSGYEEFAGVDFDMRLLHTSSKMGDPHSKAGELNEQGNVQRFLWISKKREVAFQKVTEAWWEEVKDPSNLENKLNRTTYLVEVTSPDWQGLDKGRVGPNVLLMNANNPKKQVRLSRNFVEFREITPLSLRNTNATVNGHGGWTQWKKMFPGSFY